MTEERMFGLWPSPVTPRMLGASLRLSEPSWDSDGRTLAWLEGRSDRGVIVVQEGTGAATRDLTPPEFSVRALVGNGGGDFALDRGVAYFVNQGDQRIYRQALAGGPPRAITPGFGAASTPIVSPDGDWLLYVHSYEGVDRLTVVDVEGRGWPVVFAEGSDFVMQPAWHPSGRQAAWVEWDHLSMPWDGTRLVLATVTYDSGVPRVEAREVVAGGPATAILQPAFSRDGRWLFYVSDEAGVGQLRRRDLSSGVETVVAAAEGDFGAPAWNHNLRRYALLSDDRVLAIEDRQGFDHLWTGQAGEMSEQPELGAGYTVLGSPAASPTDGRVALVASGGDQPLRLVVIDTEGTVPPVVVRRSDGETTPRSAFSRPQPFTSSAPGGGEIHSLYFPPASDRFHGAGAPPVVVIVHGGPTTQVQAGWNPQAQFFATRGYAVLVPNYRGSTGYGRPYMEALRGQWGVTDVDDCAAAVEALAATGLCDPSRAVIFGGSAGGYTVLQSLAARPRLYRAGVAMYGISNLFSLATDTHKFEARYLDSLVGPLPDAAATYRERSPLFNVERIVDAVALFQGADDRVVPREQSDSIAASLRARGVPHEYHVYDGEGHGWRKSETIDHFWTAVERFLREHVLYA